MPVTRAMAAKAKLTPMGDLGKLSPELRNRIYSYCFQSEGATETVMTWYQNGRKLHTVRPASYGLLGSSRQIRAEAAPMFFHNHSFRVTHNHWTTPDPETLDLLESNQDEDPMTTAVVQTFLDKIADEHLPLLRNVDIELWLEWDGFPSYDGLKKEYKRSLFATFLGCKNIFNLDLDPKFRYVAIFDMTFGDEYCRKYNSGDEQLQLEFEFDLTSPLQSMREIQAGLELECEEHRDWYDPKAGDCACPKTPGRKCNIKNCEHSGCRCERCRLKARKVVSAPKQADILRYLLDDASAFVQQLDQELCKEMGWDEDSEESSDNETADEQQDADEGSAHHEAAVG